MPEVTILRDVNVDVERGDVVGVIGESGCGKSTLARVMAGLLPSAEGEIILDGKTQEGDLRDRDRDELRKVQFVFQMADTALNPRQLIGEILGRPIEFYLGFKGKEKRLSHTIGVGTPQGVNFVYDLGSANLVGMWRGDFVDATPMWHNRGNGSFNPRGAVNWTFLNQPIAQLETPDDAFPETGVAPNFVSKGYSVDKTSGLPIFKHEYNGVDIENKVTVSSSETYLIQEINFSKTGLTNWYLKLASGDVQKSEDGYYVIGGQEYYINVLSGQTPTIREVDGVSELVLPVDGSGIKYEIIW